MDAPSHYALGGKRRTRELRDRGPHRPFVVVTTIGGRFTTVAPLRFSRLCGQELRVAAI